MKRETLLIVADSERCADMLYAVGMFVPDPFIYLRINGKCHVVMSDLEIDRARQQAPHCRVLSLTAIQKKLREDGAKKTGLPQVVRPLLRSRGISKAVVPHGFPLGLARDCEQRQYSAQAVSFDLDQGRTLRIGRHADQTTPKGSAYRFWAIKHLGCRLAARNHRA